MKIFAVACGLLFFTSAAAAAAEDEEAFRVVPGQSVGKVRLGMTAAELETALGKPTAREETKTEARLEFRSPELGLVRVLIVQGKVAQIEFTSPSFHTADKLDVRTYRKFPDQFQRFRYQKELLHLRYAFQKGGLTFFEINYDSRGGEDPAPMSLGVVHAGQKPIAEPLKNAAWTAWE